MENNIKINNIYLQKNITDEMQDFFELEAFIQLNNFLKENPKKTKEQILKKQFKQIYKPLQIKREELDTKTIFDLEILKLLEFFKSKQFIQFIEEITQLELNLKSLKICKYSHKDFSILNDKTKQEDTIEVFFDLSDNSFTKDMGATLTYTTREEEVFYLNPSFNTLTILYKPQEIMKYLKYINNKAKDKNILRFEIQFEIEE